MHTGLQKSCPLSEIVFWNTPYRHFSLPAILRLVGWLSSRYAAFVAAILFFCGFAETVVHTHESQSDCVPCSILAPGRREESRASSEPNRICRSSSVQLVLSLGHPKYQLAAALERIQFLCHPLDQDQPSSASRYAKQELLGPSDSRAPPRHSITC